MQLAAHGNASQRLLLEAQNQLDLSKDNSSMLADIINQQREQRINTGTDLNTDDFIAEVLARASNDDVSSELFTKREIEVLRAKISKRISLQ